MALISKLEQLVNGVSRQVDLSANTLVVQQLNTGSGGLNTGTNTLTDAILGNLITLQNGTTSVSPSLHAHDGIYTRTTALTSTTPGSAGSTVIGDNNSYSNFTPTAATVKGALSGIDSALASVTSAANKSLSNLTATSINQSLIPGTSGTLTLGANAQNWLAGYIQTLKNGAGVTAIDIFNSYLVDGAGHNSIDWVNRYLIDSAGTNQLTWSASGVNINKMAAALNLNSFQINNLAAPSVGTDAVNKTYVDNAIAGLSWKQPVAAASIGSNINLAAPGATLDGYTFVSGDRFLAKDQSTGSQNGIYIWNGAAAAATRSTDANTWTELVNSVMLVTNGTVNQGSKWVNTNIAGGTIGTTAVTFVAFSVAGTVNGTGTANYVAYWSGTSTLTAEQYLSTVRGGLGVNASGFTGVLKFASGVASASAIVASDLGTITDGVTLDQSGAGSTLEIKAGGVGTTQLASNAVTAAKIATGAFDGLTITGGGGSAAAVQNAPAVKRSLVAGQAFSANTTYAVRWGLVANGETSGRIYAADITTASYDLFYVIGMAQSGTAVSAGQNITVTGLGSLNLASGDTAFGSGTDGKPVFLTATGTFSLTAPSTAGQAITRIGIVQVGSATNTSCVIDINPNPMGVN